MKLIGNFLFVVGALVFFLQVIPYCISSDNWLIFLLGIIGIPVGLAVVIAFIKSQKEAILNIFKRFSQFFILFLLAVITMNCSRVPAGYVGIKVYLLGDSKGVDSEELGVGRYWIGINEELYLFPTFTQNYVWTASPAEGSPNDESIEFQSKEGLSVKGDFGISYRIDPTKVNLIFQKYRKGLEEITDIYLRNMVRDALTESASRQNVEYLYGEGKSALMDSVEKTVKAQVLPFGIIVEKIYAIGKFQLPETVTDALNSKIEAKQRAEQRENELREAEAQAAKEIAKARGESESVLIRARADAEALRLKRLQISKDLNQYEAIQRWDGKLSTYLGSGMVPFIELK